MQPRQQSPGYGSLLNTVNSGLMQMQNTPAYDSPSVRLHEQRIANIQNQADAAANVYNQMGQPRVGSQFSQNRAAGFQTDQYGRQYQMTPQMAGTAMPTGGVGAWMQGRSLSGAPAGVYVQSNLPAPSGGMERSLAGMAGQRPSAFAGPASSAAIAAMTGGRGPGSEAYQAMRARRQQQADQRIVARARIRGLGQNTPAVRLAMQRLGMVNPSGTAPATERPGGVGSGPGQTMAGSGVQVPPNARSAGVRAAQLAKNPFLVNALQGVEPGSAPASLFLPLLQSTSNPADAKTLQEFIVNRSVADPGFLRGLPLEQKLLFDAFTSGGASRLSQMQESNRQHESMIRQQPGIFSGGAYELGNEYRLPFEFSGDQMSKEDQARILREQSKRTPYRGSPQF